MSPASLTHTIEVFEITWQGIAITIDFESPYLNMEDSDIVHLEVTSKTRERLPITETGYRSCFAPAAEIAEAGGPVAYAMAWLDYMSNSKEWRAYAEASRQLSLF
jgi:hypothetical protein